MFFRTEDAEFTEGLNVFSHGGRGVRGWAQYCLRTEDAKGKVNILEILFAFLFHFP